MDDTFIMNDIFVMDDRPINHNNFIVKKFFLRISNYLFPTEAKKVILDIYNLQEQQHKQLLALKKNKEMQATRLRKINEIHNLEKTLTDNITSIRRVRFNDDTSI